MDRLISEQADGDLISRSRMLAILKENYEFMVVDGYTDLFKDFIKFIKNQPSVAISSTEPKWIPVSEPPKELGTYLIQTDGEPYMCQCRWTDVNPFWTDYKTKPHWNIFDLPQYSKVVAWMPLPAPYESQESEVSDANCD